MSSVSPPEHSAGDGAKWDQYHRYTSTKSGFRWDGQPFGGASRGLIVAAGHVHLILSHSTDDFYLEIPISVVQSNSVRPIKYLRFLGWCIMGILGTVRSDRAGADLADNALLQNQAIYFYVYDAPDDDAALQYAVDLEVIKARSHISASDSSARNRATSFKETLVQRDASCIFTNAPQLLCQGTHIIPFHKGDEWFDLIVKSRPASPNEDASTLITVDDQRNGMLLGAEVHIVAESRQVAILKTPNLVLGVNDIPACHTRALPDHIKYPDGQRYTLQWLDGDSPELLAGIPNNSDATFRKYPHIPKPSLILLHYKYGAAAVKWWGHGPSSHLGISNRPTMPRPSVPVPAATGPIRTKRTPSQVDAPIQKCATGNMGGSGSGPRDSEAARDEEVMDPDEIIMFFWSQNPAALERRKREAEDRKREEEERASRMEQWRESVITV
ncbi:hypothetical protein B0H17DRAFT_957194 [Mycena rosella]|uniref:HNH nuclease domain-containing protein n=1 Tax=Mycena rosella TaxID=1033263 RepID=A0AAD7CNG2_MYCRO|nr:hypothetical protein B0H17DRAFT_957194 [Mycena rosella]